MKKAPRSSRVFESIGVRLENWSFCKENGVVTSLFLCIMKKKQPLIRQPSVDTFSPGGEGRKRDKYYGRIGIWQFRYFSVTGEAV